MRQLLLLFLLLILLLLFILFLIEILSFHSSGCPEIQYVDQAGFKLRHPLVSTSQALGLKVCSRKALASYFLSWSLFHSSSQESPFSRFRQGMRTFEKRAPGELFPQLIPLGDSMPSGENTLHFCHSRLMLTIYWNMWCKQTQVRQRWFTKFYN